MPRASCRSRRLRIDGAIDIASVETEFKYEGYLKRQELAVERQRRQEGRAIPEGFVFAGIPGLSREMVERLSQYSPRHARPGVAHSRRDPRSCRPDCELDTERAHFDSGLII